MKTIMILLAGILLVGLLGSSASCSKQVSSTTPAKDTGTVPVSKSTPSPSAASTVSAKPSPSASAATGNIIKLKTISYIDQQGTGKEAFKLLIPTDWQSEGGVQWVMDNPSMPAVSQFRVWNPKGAEQFQVLPNQAFFWTDNQLTSQLFPVGSKYYGNEVRKPLKPVQALEQIIIPRFRANVQNLKIVSEQDITNLVKPSASGGASGLATSKEAGKIHLEYSENGIAMEDEIYCLVEQTFIPVQSMYGATTNAMWGVNFISSFRAEKGKLDTNSKIFQTISKSVTLNVNWFNTYVQVVEYLIKMNIQQIKSTGQLGSIIAQTGTEIRQENLDLYNQREASNDKISDQFSQYVRGVDSYYDPVATKNVELPAGYDNVWVNNLGDYVLSDNSSYNPNIGGNQNFQKLTKSTP